MIGPGSPDLVSEYNKSYIAMDRKFRLNWDA